MRAVLGALALLVVVGVVPAEAQVVSIVRQYAEPFDALDAGRTLMRLWLTLSRAGLYAHPLSQILDCPSTHRQISDRVGRAVQEEVMCLFRFGASPPPAQSRRLTETYDGTG